MGNCEQENEREQHVTPNIQHHLKYDIPQTCPEQGGHKIGEKNSLSFLGFSRAINLLFHRLSQQKVNVMMTFIKGHPTSTPAI